MKLKLVVASMSLLGLISCPLFAADTQATTTSTDTTATSTDTGTASTTTTTTTKVKKHRRHRRHHYVSQYVAADHPTYKDFKDIAPVVVCPRVDYSTLILDGMSHNLGRAKPTVHCMDPISFAGGINFDSTWGARNIGYSGENVARFSLNDAYVNVYGNVNSWTTAFASLSFANFAPYNTDNTRYAGPAIPGLPGVVAPSSSPGYQTNGVYSNSYTGNQVNLEQGFITFQNMSVWPIFVRVGKMFTDFDRYDIHPITESFSQVMSESLKTQAQLGFLTNVGLNGSVYTFENPMRRVSFTPATGTTPFVAGSYDSHNKNNWGASLNWDVPSDTLGYGIGVAYMYDFTGVDQVSYGVQTFNNGLATATLFPGNLTGRGNVQGVNGSYQNRVSGGTIYANLNTGPFAFNFHYVTAMQSFNGLDLATRTQAAIAAGGARVGAEPWAADIMAAYGFNSWGHDQNIYIGYNQSGQAVNLFLPRSRWLLGYGVQAWKNTNLGLQWNHDNSYSSNFTGTDVGSSNASNGVVLRAAVTFG